MGCQGSKVASSGRRKSDSPSPKASPEEYAPKPQERALVREALQTPSVSAAASEPCVNSTQTLPANDGSSSAVPRDEGATDSEEPKEVDASFEAQVRRLLEERPLKDLDMNIPAECEAVQMKNGVVYRGEWRNGQQHGRGEQQQPGGVLYEGQFKAGKICGLGRLTRPDGSAYEGPFVDGKADTQRQGVGVYTFVDGSKYVGQWAADKREGFGLEALADGSLYLGGFQGGLKAGHGVMRASNGDAYDGHFLKGEMSGLPPTPTPATPSAARQGLARGEQQEDLVDFCLGMDGCASGNGTYTWPDGRVYTGEWRASRMQGRGVLSFPDGRRYEGDFNESRMEGVGALHWADGSYYEGEFKAGKPHGEGRHVSAAAGDSHSQSGRLALWNQGVRVKWLEEKAQDEDSGETRQAPEAVVAA